jgi:hypothetical protein
MRKLIFLFIMFVIPVVGFSQGLFKPVAPFPTQYRSVGAMGTEQISHKWEWRLDGTVQFSEINYNKATKLLETNAVLGVGPAIGYQHYISTVTGEAFNNYGFSGALLVGERIKFALQMNVMQYFKFGIAITPNPAIDFSPVGVFFGGGITF